MPAQSVFSTFQSMHTHTHTHTDTHTTILRLYGFCPGQPGRAGTRTNLDFTEARHSEWQWYQLVNVSSGTGSPGLSRTKSREP